MAKYRPDSRGFADMKVIAKDSMTITHIEQELQKSNVVQGETSTQTVGNNAESQTQNHAQSQQSGGNKKD
jgi:hypothetical protein